MCWRSVLTTTQPMARPKMSPATRTDANTSTEVELLDNKEAVHGSRAGVNEVTC